MAKINISRNLHKKLIAEKCYRFFKKHDILIRKIDKKKQSDNREVLEYPDNINTVGRIWSF